MVEFIVETVQKLLKGESFELLNEIVSDSSYIDSCCSIIEDDESYDFSIRFNVSNGMLLELLKKFASTFSDEQFQELDSFFLRLLQNDNSINTKNSIFNNSILANSIGRCYGCLIYSYRKNNKEEETNFLNIYDRVIPEITQDAPHQIAFMNILSGMCQYFGSLSERSHFHFQYDTMVQIAFDAASHLFQEEQLNGEASLILASLNLINNFLLMNSRSGNSETLEEVIAFFCISGVRSSVQTISSPQFLQSFLKEFFLRNDDSSIRLLCLEIFYNFASIMVNEFTSPDMYLRSYNYIIQDLQIFIEYIFHNPSDPAVWEYINWICEIAIKIQRNLKHDHYKKILSYHSFLESFFHLSFDIIFGIESEFGVIDQFFEKSQPFFLCLIFWKQFTKVKWDEHKAELDQIKESVLSYIVEIDQKCIDFLFAAIQQNPEEAFSSFHEIQYSFEFIELLVNTMRFNLPFFCEHLINILKCNCENYYQSNLIENELNLTLILCISTQFIMSYSKIPQFEIQCLNFLPSEDETENSLTSFNHNLPNQDDLSMFQILLEFINVIVGLIEKFNDEKILTDYLSLHQNEATIPTFLENSIMSFMYGFYNTVYNECSMLSDYYSKFCQDNPLFTCKNDILNIFIHRLYCDVVVFQNCQIQYNDILSRVRDIISEYGTKLIFENGFFDRFFTLKDLIHDIKYYKAFVSLLYKIYFDISPQKDKEQTLLRLFHDDTETLDQLFKAEHKSVDLLIRLLTNFSTLFSIVSSSHDYQYLFQNIFLPNIEKLDQNAEFLFTDQTATPYSLSFILSVIKGKSRIEFDKHSPNGILLFKTTMKFLSYFYNHLHSHANDGNISNYLKCINRSLKVYNTIITAKYVMFRALQIYNDSTLVNSIQSITAFLMHFNLKNLFNYPKIGKQLKELAINLFENHQKEVFAMEPTVIQFLFEILEYSLFAPNMNIVLNKVYITISNFISFVDGNESMKPLCELLAANFNRLFLEMWQIIFNSPSLQENAINVLFCLFSLFNGYPENSREIILNAVHNEFAMEFNQHLETILNDSSTLKNEIKDLHKLAVENFPCGLKIFNSFPYNWNSPE